MSTSTGRLCAATSARLGRVGLVRDPGLIDKGGRRQELFGAINNLFSKGPPAPVYSIANYTLFYDAIGASFRGGLRFSY